MNELLYGVSSTLIAVILLISMGFAIEAGYRVGLRNKASVSEASREHINGIQASILGILALLLGFTFSLSLQRYDSRSEAVVDEANAIGTAYMRAQLLPSPLRVDAMNLLSDYLDLRVLASSPALHDAAERQAIMDKTVSAQTGLWAYSRKGIELDPVNYTPVLFVEAVNTVIDSYGKRDAALNRHVPEVVLFLLYGTFLMAGAIVGYSTGVAGHRPSLVSYIMVVLIVVLVFIILDLDRPRRGLIQVSQKSMTDLQASIHRDAAAPYRTR